MSIDYAVEVQEAIRTILLADSTLTSTHGIKSVTDFARPSAAYPYITLGDITVVPNPAKDNAFFEYTFTIHVWVKKRADTTRDIMSRIYTLLDNVQLSLSSGVCPTGYFLSNLVIRDPDGITIHGVTRFVIKT